MDCHYSSLKKIYTDGDIEIVNCVGHLYDLAPPEYYGSEFKNWRKLPVIPEQFIYVERPETAEVCHHVIELIKKHRNDEILVATDADREGEIIARECLLKAGITDYSKIKRFWVSQALIPDVIRNGIAKAKPLSSYNQLAAQGFARQHADWLVGINLTRLLTVKNPNSKVLAVGRVQTAVLAEIANRCNKIAEFTPEKYYEFEGHFSDSSGRKISGHYFDKHKRYMFLNQDEDDKFAECKKAAIKILSVDKQDKNCNPPLLYNLTNLQKDAFRFFNFPAAKTLKIVQKLYEEYQCVSYPRTPSTVMGTANVELCKHLYDKMIKTHIEYSNLVSKASIDRNNPHIFNDAKLESHHALIPLAPLPETATVEDENIYYLILEHFLLAFLPPEHYERTVVELDINGCNFTIIGKRVIDPGWKQFRILTKILEEKAKTIEADSEVQDLSNFDFDSITLDGIEKYTKMTKSPKYYNEASILSFMENPKAEAEDGCKLVGLGTPATKHMFIPKLIQNGCVDQIESGLKVTDKGLLLLGLLVKLDAPEMTNVAKTTEWERQLETDPEQFENDIKRYVSSVCSNLVI